MPPILSFTGSPQPIYQAADRTRGGTGRRSAGPRKGTGSRGLSPAGKGHAVFHSSVHVARRSSHSNTPPFERRRRRKLIFLWPTKRFPRPRCCAGLQSEPHQFSANVLLRPVVQDYLLPTLAYVGGAAEVAYFGQGAVVYKALLGRATPILPRFSATIVEAKPQALLERYGLTVPDIFQAPKQLRESSGKAYAAGRLAICFRSGGRRR